MSAPTEVPTKEFSGKVVLITGASSGIGATTAIHFSKLGANIVITGRNVENLQKVSQQCATKPLLIKADVTKENDVISIIDTTIKHFGKLDVLVNNAGVFEMGTIETTNIKQFDTIFNTNVRAIYQLTNLAVSHLIASKGNIINVSSIAGLKSFQSVLSYCMSKAALDQFTKCISLELGPKGVRVNSVNPGAIETDIFNRSGMSPKDVNTHMEKSKNTYPLRRVGKPEEVAELIVFLASDKAGFVTGSLVPIDGGRQNV